VDLIAESKDALGDFAHGHRQHCVQLLEQEAPNAELALAVDLIAERIRALGVFAPGSYSQFAKLSSVAESTAVPSARDMIADLVKGQETVVQTARKVFPLAEKAGDQATADLLTQRMQLHEKTAWMLRSMLE